jgi:hypothetical protein
MKKFVFFLASIVAIFLSSCASSKVTTTISNGYALNQYKYVVYSSENNGDAELDDIIMMVQNLISEKCERIIMKHKLYLYDDLAEKM